MSIHTYKGQIPGSLQAFFANLSASPYLGVAMADERRIIDANDALLGMLGRTREQLTAGEIDWLAITPEKFYSLDIGALEQLREFGTCVPYEKEFIFPTAVRCRFCSEQSG